MSPISLHPIGATPKVTDDGGSRRPRLLLVDDTPSNLDVLVGALRDDYELRVATRGEKALALCDGSERFDLVLLDVMMPGMDGFEVCRRLRERPEMREVPIIFITARAGIGDVVSGLESGANDYLAKPLRPEELRARVRSHLIIREQQQQISAKNRELRELLQIVSHDVANQFAVLQMVTDLLGRQDTVPQRYIPMLTAAVRNGIGLTNLVRELRRVDDKGLTLSVVHLDEAVAEAVLLARERATAKGLTMRVDVAPLAVKAERCSLTNSVVGNLLSNAIKFSRPGGAIEVSADAVAGHAVLVVRDQGVGMDSHALEHLFDYGRSHSRAGTDGERGAGFGMPLMRKFVTNYGGRVEVRSRPESAGGGPSGTEFRIYLPLA